MFEGIERRAEPRRKEARIVKYTLEAGDPAHIYYGVTGNMSADGCWFYTTRNLHRGDTILFEDDKALPCRAGTVRWTRKIAGIYQIGVECIRLRAI